MAGGCTRLAGHCLLRREIDPIQLERKIKSHGAEKILFASDCPWSDPRREKVMIEALDLRQREKDAIFSQNILRLLDL